MRVDARLRILQADGGGVDLVEMDDPQRSAGGDRFRRALDQLAARPRDVHAGGAVGAVEADGAPAVAGVDPDLERGPCLGCGGVAFDVELGEGRPLAAKRLGRDLERLPEQPEAEVRKDPGPDAAGGAAAGDDGVSAVADQRRDAGSRPVVLA